MELLKHVVFCVSVDLLFHISHIETTQRQYNAICGYHHRHSRVLVLIRVCE